MLGILSKKEIIAYSITTVLTVTAAYLFVIGTVLFLDRLLK